MLVIFAVIELYCSFQCNVLINYCVMIVGCVGAAAVSDDDDVDLHVSDASQPTDALVDHALHLPSSTPVVTGLMNLFLTYVMYSVHIHLQLCCLNIASESLDIALNNSCPICVMKRYFFPFLFSLFAWYYFI